MRRIATDMTRAAKVVECLPSHWPDRAEVLVTDCGHRHLRPIGFYATGDTMHCPFCADPPPPDIGTDVPGGGAA